MSKLCLTIKRSRSRSSNEQLSATRNNGNGQNKENNSLAANPPSAEELEEWISSFDKVMLDQRGRALFSEFLRHEYSEENLLFWQAVEDLQTVDAQEVEPRVRQIYEDFISILSPKEVSIDSKVRDIINQNMVEPSRHTFNEAQLQIYTLMGRDSFPRFLNSDLLKSYKTSIGYKSPSPTDSAAPTTSGSGSGRPASSGDKPCTPCASPSAPVADAAPSSNSDATPGDKQQTSGASSKV